jgi:hypothetical protein
MKDIYVFIVENQELAQTLVRDHFNSDGITYAELLREDKRDAVVKALENI